MNVTGSCHCGQISFEAEVDTDRVALCNCTDCQVMTGSAFRVVVQAASEEFRLLSGTPKKYVKTGESGTKRRHYFCDNCGSPVYATDDVDDPPRYSLRVGGLAQRRSFAPTRRVWCRSAVPWLGTIEAIPGAERQ